jgi:hypothetical protein
MQKIEGKELSSVDSNLSLHEVNVTLGGVYEFRLRPITTAMLNMSDDAGNKAHNMIRYSMVSSSHFDIEYEDIDICGDKFNVAKLASLERLPAGVTAALADAVRAISCLGPANSLSIDFSPAV